MPGKFNFEKRYKYPHLIGDDSKVWNRFIDEYPLMFATVDYDVHVGEGAKVFTIPDEKSQQYWTQLTKKRIDVIGYYENKITIIEVKKRVGLYTLGQILGYKFLFLHENPDIKTVQILIVCESISQDDINVLDHFAIPYLVV